MSFNKHEGIQKDMRSMLTLLWLSLSNFLNVPICMPCMPICMPNLYVLFHCFLWCCMHYCLYCNVEISVKNKTKKQMAGGKNTCRGKKIHTFIQLNDIKPFFLRSTLGNHWKLGLFRWTLCDKWYITNNISLLLFVKSKAIFVFYSTFS